MSSSRRFLIHSALAPSTISKYKTGVLLFLQWCDENKRDAATIGDLDDIIN